MQVWAQSSSDPKPNEAAPCLCPGMLANITALSDDEVALAPAAADRAESQYLQRKRKLRDPAQVQEVMPQIRRSLRCVVLSSLQSQELCKSRIQT